MDLRLLSALLLVLVLIGERQVGPLVADALVEAAVDHAPVLPQGGGAAEVLGAVGADVVEASVDGHHVGDHGGVVLELLPALLALVNELTHVAG